MLNEELSSPSEDNANDDNYQGIKIYSEDSFANICKDLVIGDVRTPGTCSYDKEVCVGSGRFRVCHVVTLPGTKTCTKRLIAQYCVPSDISSEIEKAVIECIKVGVATAGAISIIVENPAVFVPALKLSVEACLIGKGIDIASQVTVGLRAQSKGCSDCSPL